MKSWRFDISKIKLSSYTTIDTSTMPVSAEEILKTKSKQNQRALVVEPWVTAHLGDLWISLRKGLLSAGKKDFGSTAPVYTESAPNRS
jgi:hypothetical protein